MSLTLTGIGLCYGRGNAWEQRALADVSVHVEPGELVLVLGVTGSGKSTLLRIMSGLLAADEGSATIDGSPLGPASARGAVGLVFQDAESQLFSDTVLDDVAFGPRNLGLSAEEARTRAEAAMDAVGLAVEQYAERSPFALSGGEARRAAIAGVLAMQPAYLLADEPSAGLDAPGRRAVRDLLCAQRERAGIVVVSHSAQEWLGAADRVVLLSAGRVSWQGTAEALVADPEQYRRAGLRAPDVVEVQRLARAAGHALDHYELDPLEAARALLAGGGCE